MWWLKKNTFINVLNSKKVSEDILLLKTSIKTKISKENDDVYSACICDRPFLLFFTKSVSPCSLDFTRMQRFDHSITHAAEPILGSAHSAPGLAGKLDRWFISPGDWAIITRRARGGRLLCIGIVLTVLPPGNVFHTSSCRVKKYFTPLGFAERDVHTKADGVYLW